MKFKKIIILTLFFLSLTGGFSQQHNDEAIDRLIHKYEESNSLSYDITYSIKFFDRDEPLYEYGTVQIRKEPADTIFDAQFSYEYYFDDEDTEEKSTKITKIYIDHHNLYVIEPHENQITKFNPALNQIFTITGRTDGDLINTYFPNIQSLKTALDNDKNKVEYSDTSDYLKVSIRIPDEEEIFDQQKTILIDKKENVIKQIKFRAHYKDQIQLNQWDLSDIKFDAIEEGYFERQIESALKKYTLSEFEPPTEDDLALMKKGGKAPLITGYLYPNYEDEVELKFTKITLLDFWYTACIPCVKSIPKLNELQKEFEDQIEIIGVNDVDYKPEQKDKIEKFLKRTPIDYKVLLTDEIPEEYNITAYPSFYLLDENGKVMYTGMGYTKDTFQELKKVIARYK